MYRAVMGRVYGRFFELPTPVVLLALWVAGVALEGLCAVELYAIYWHGMFLAERLAEVGS
jgi:hypothetical protein